MPTRIRRFAFCAAVDEENGNCLMIYENDLNAIELRASFPGVQTGKWYRLDASKGARRSWEAVEERLPTRTMRRKGSGDGAKCGELIQLCLPIFFVPNFKCFGCTFDVTSSAAFNDKMHFNFVSPRLEGPGQINFSTEQLTTLDLRPGEQCFAFLTLNFRGSGSTIKPPQWTLNSVEDFHKVNADPLVPALAPSVSLSLCAPKEWGILLNLVVDSEDERNGMGLILCLRDGRLAFGRILRVDRHNDSWRANIGDIVGFSLIEVGCFNQPVRMALNVIAWQSAAFASVDPNILFDQFPQDALPEFPSVRLAAKNAGKMAQSLFELCFAIDDSQISYLSMGSLREGRLGVLIDRDGELLSALNNMKRKGTELVPLLLARVRARFCPLPEQQQHLWILVEMLEIAKMQSDAGHKRKTAQEQKSVTDGNCERIDSQREIENGGSKVGGQPHEQFSKISVEDGAFGVASIARHEKCHPSNNSTAAHTQPTALAESVTAIPTKEAPSSAVVPIANAMAKLGKALNMTESSKNTQQQKQPLGEREGTVVCTGIKGEEIYWAFYDEQKRNFTRAASTKSIKVQLLVSQSPNEGEWFRISYQNYKTTMASIMITQIRPLKDFSHLPIHFVNSENKDVLEKLKKGKFDGINLWEGPPSKEKNAVCSQMNEDEAQTAQQQQQKPPRGKTPQPIRRNTPVPVTNVFMRQKDPPSQQSKANANSVGVNSPPPFLKCSSKFFTVQTQMVGVVVYDYTIFPEQGEFEFYEYEIWPFCTGRSKPRQLFLRSSIRLPIGHWLKFSKEDYDQLTLKKRIVVA